jgi:hypothetical protein
VTDESGPAGDSDATLSPEQERRVSSALAAARVTGDTPDDVAGRLDATLADLVAERDDPRAHDPGRDRHLGRGRRWLLVAGAASVVAVVAFSVPALRPDSSSLGSADKSGSSAANGPTGIAKDAPRDGSRAGSGGAVTDRQLVRLSSGSFRSDVRRLLAKDHSFGLAPLSEAARSPSATSGQASCTASTPPPGVLVQRTVLLDGEPVLLDVFRTRAGTRTVQAVSCDGSRTLASTRVPAP